MGFSSGVLDRLNKRFPSLMETLNAVDMASAVERQKDPWASAYRNMTANVVGDVSRNTETARSRLV
ncbi:MAG: hypothetical protein CMH52_04370 [Myxococcales bacterium]|nr:hypothetical protein [Myxococcales bacterium]